MELVQCLEERIKYSTKYPDCVACRAVFYIWNEEDKAANDFCKDLKQRVNGQAEPIAINKTTDVSGMLQEKWKSCVDKMDAREAAYRKGIYVLAIGPPFAITERIKLPGNGVIEFAIITEDNRQERAAHGENASFYTRWRIRKADIGAAALLLLHAAYDDCLIRPNHSSGYYEFGLKYDEYNIAREELCCHYLTILNRRLSESRFDLEIIEEKLSIEKNIKKICDKWIKPEWIPIVGYDVLIKELEDQHQKNFLQKWVSITRKNTVQTKRSIEEVLSIFNGRVDGKPKAEWLRYKVRTKELPALCDRMIVQEGDKIWNAINAYFSYYDICYSLPQKLKQYSQNLDEDIAIAEKDIETTLQSNFASKSPEIGDVLEGMNQYYSLWDNYIRICAKKEYINGVVELLKEKNETVLKNYQELGKVKNILENSQNKIWKPRMEPKEDVLIAEQIDDKESLMEMIGKFNCYSEFERGAVSEIRNMADVEYQRGSDNNVDDSKRPQFHLIFNNELAEEESENQLCFEWFDHPVSYISRSLIVQLRIYPYPG